MKWNAFSLCCPCHSLSSSLFHLSVFASIICEKLVWLINCKDTDALYKLCKKVIYSFICDNFFYYFVEDYLIVIILLVNMYEGWPRKRELLRYFVNYKTNLYNFLPFIDKCYNLYNNFKKIVLLANKYKKKHLKCTNFRYLGH